MKPRSGRVVKLSNNAEIDIMFFGNALTLAGEDRALMKRLLDLLDEYEQAQQSAAIAAEERLP